MKERIDRATVPPMAAVSLVVMRSIAWLIVGFIVANDWLFCKNNSELSGGVTTRHTLFLLRRDEAL